jgi:hypothetical protein
MEWNAVRGDVEHALKRLNVGIRPISLPCQFRPLPAPDDHKGEKPHHLIPVFIFEKGNNRAKAVLKRALNLRDDALWDYEPATGQVMIPDALTETRLATTGDFKKRFRVGNGLDLTEIYKGLQEILDAKELKPYQLQPRPRRANLDRVRFITVWVTCCKTKYFAYAWRIRVTLDPTGDAWELISKIEIGKRYASEVDFGVVADSMRGDFLSVHVDVGKSSSIHDNNRRVVMRPKFIEGEPVKAEVPPPIERLDAKEVSPYHVRARVRWGEENHQEARFTFSGRCFRLDSIFPWTGDSLFCCLCFNRGFYLS